MNLILIVLFLIMLVMGCVKQEFKTTGFWFQVLVGTAIILTFGIPKIS